MFAHFAADGLEESTITRKRKLRINCTQSSSRIEYANGKETKVEGKTTVLNNLNNVPLALLPPHAANHRHFSALTNGDGSGDGGGGAFDIYGDDGGGEMKGVDVSWMPNLCRPYSFIFFLVI